MTDIYLYNTLSRNKQKFEPIDCCNVRMYVCGPTVYDRAHLGNARPPVTFDILNRLLRYVYGDEHVTYVSNITDVDDKILNISIPSKKEIAGVHKLLMQIGGFEGEFTDLYIKCLGYNINYCKLRIILDILEEFNLISFLRTTGGIKLNEIKGKIDLNDASILKRLGVQI